MRLGEDKGNEGEEDNEGEDAESRDVAKKQGLTEMS